MKRHSLRSSTSQYDLLGPGEISPDSIVVATPPWRKGQKHVKPEESYPCISKIQGQVISARGLDDNEFHSPLKPYCVVKGIRPNDRMVDIHLTTVMRGTSSPHWLEEFSFTCPEAWGFNGLIGLKFLLFDLEGQQASNMGSDKFLGGVDVGILGLVSERAIELDFELEGRVWKKGKYAKQPKKKPHLTLEVTVFRTSIPRHLDLRQRLMDSLNTYVQITRLDCRISRAKNLPKPEHHRNSEAQCVVRIVMLSGKVEELYRTRTQRDSNPVWEEQFRSQFLPGEEPVLLLFDVFHDDDSGDSTEGDHLGSAWASIFDFLETPKRTLRLIGESQLLESLLDREGFSTRLERDANSSPSSPLSFSSVRRTGARHGSLRVECRLSRKTRDMPLASIMHEPQEISHAGDIHQILPEWDVSKFSVPRELRKIREGGRMPAGLLRGGDTVLFLSGVLHGAMALPRQEGLESGDPYCVVDGVSNAGDQFFIHRTRPLRCTLSPDWGESFFVAVPEGAHIDRLWISVFDSHEDEFYGAASLDLHLLLNCERFCEYLSLGGATVRMGRQKQSLNLPSICVEVRCVKRVEPHFERFAHGRAAEWGMKRHTATRKLPGDVVDVSQGDVQLQPDVEVSSRVWHLHVTHQLASLATRQTQRFRQWLSRPDSRTRTAPAAQQSRAATPQAPVLPTITEGPPLSAQLQHPVRDLSETPAGDPAGQLQLADARSPSPESEKLAFTSLRGAPLPLTTSVSLPALTTNFGRQAEAAVRQTSTDREWLEAIRFRGDFERVAALQRQELCEVPGVEALTLG